MNIKQVAALKSHHCVAGKGDMDFNAELNPRGSRSKSDAGKPQKYFTNRACVRYSREFMAAS